ncbi:CRISPR-associated helicase Cas3' [Kineobactrum salinum]|uniref:CRISPR-associated helicase Cas3 n=1 Tax=Kineobactrum salinum TaxID=2708301 RepID=A0A6C0TYA9_9GAMM|nr:CRISPR-associated helicase Cas3' [Kineobactrum salinum]QIB64628.1 CRISPR-associated helicase Cas3' [Kineobactrum salinum]
MTAHCHLLPYHLLDVAAVGEQVLRARPELEVDLAEFLGITSAEFRSLFLFGLLLHDLGKMTASFQSLFEAMGLVQIHLPEGVSYSGKTGRHDQLGYDVWKQAQRAAPIFHGTATAKRCFQFYLGIFWGHHGKPVRQEKTVPAHDKLRLTEHDVGCAQAWINDCQIFLGEQPSLHYFSDQSFAERLRQVSWLLAGLGTYCDWVGSDSDIFEYCDQWMPLPDYWREIALPRALKAIAKTEVFEPVTIQPFHGFNSLFSFSPSPLQSYAEQVPVTQTPQLFILEDLTGAGKTEAALVLTHRLLQSGAGRGLYLGLPTMATSNAMFERVAAHYHRMLTGRDGDKPSIVLAHGARELNDRFREAALGTSAADRPYDAKEDEQTASLHCSQWLADSRKKALLAPVGVGTVDQVLLAILPKRHQSLRVLGLYGKVLILDEVHAADDYMLTLLEKLMTLHASQGGSLIMLTATLPLARRQKLVQVWQRVLGQKETPLERTGLDDFPLATAVSYEAGLREERLPCRPGTEKQVAVDFVHSEADCLDRLVRAVEAGQCAVWVRNSVDEAISAYRQLRDQLARPDQCLLFHSRFVLQHRKEREAWVMAHFGKTSTQTERAGKVLIATQVFQESLDVDADVMISDLCLIDDLIQRAGRLHRHTRDASGKPNPSGPDDREPPRLMVHAPKWSSEPDRDWLKDHSPNTQYVYQRPGRIWRTMTYLHETGELRLPEESRRMIEYVYGEDVVIPEALQQAEREYDGKARGSSNQGHFNALDLEKGYTPDSNRAWTEDDVDIGTRLGEESKEVVLVRRARDSYEPYIEASSRAVELSTVKLAGKKRSSGLVTLNEEAREAFIQCYPRAKFSLLVDAETTPYTEVEGWGNPRGDAGNV